METGGRKNHPFIDFYWRLDPWLGSGIILFGAASPLWGPVLAWTLRWPPSLGLRVAVGPAGGLLLAGCAHEFLHHRTALPSTRTAPIESLINAIFLLFVTVLPIVRHLKSGRRISGAPAGSRRLFRS